MLIPNIVISHVSPVEVPSVSELQSMFPKVFDSESESPIVGFKARLVLKPNAIPVKHRAYKVPFGLVDTANKLLDSWVSRGVATRTRHAEWVSPGFLVLKKNGEYRMVVDLKKKTLNPQLRIDHYPIPCLEEIVPN